MMKQYDKKNKRMTQRIVLTFSVLLWLFALLAVRLFQVQVVQAGRFSKIAHLEHRERMTIPAVRGSIYDRNGDLVAMSTTGHSVAAFPDKVVNKVEVAERLNKILGIRVAEIEEDLQSSSAFVWIARKIDLDKAAQVRSLRMAGIEVVEEPTGKRFYPKGTLACHVLGHTGIDDQGLEGIELYYDPQLRGKPGYFLAETDGFGRVMPDGICKLVPAVSGGSLTLTIDETIQYVAENELAKAIRLHGAQHGSIVVMNPENGEILALASYPAYDGNRYGSYSPETMRDTVVSDDYEPGSTFKGILVAAALDSGKVRLDETFLSAPELKIGGWKIQNAADGFKLDSPYQDLETIMKASLNVGAASVALKIGTPTYWEMIRRLGFSQKTGIDLPGEVSGSIPGLDDKTQDVQWKDVQLATIGFGQGISVTPIQLVTAYAALANGGYLVHPHLLKQLSFPDGAINTELVPRGKTQILNSTTVEEIKFILSQVVKKGTGTEAAVPGYTSAGKTGTAQISENGRYLAESYVASFVGFVPVEKPALVILVKIDKPGFPYWGGTVAAPVFRAVANQALWHLQIPPSAGMTQIGEWKVWGEDKSR